MEPSHDKDAKRLSAVVLDSLDGNCSTADLARRAYQSRTPFHRLFRAIVEETPAAMRRRLLLERAAWQLSHTAQPVTDVALDAGYGSLEAFSRAFRKAFATSPSLYRRIGTLHMRLPSPNGIHFASPRSRPKGANNMDLFERFSGNDSWHTRKLLGYAALLTDEQLDRPLTQAVEELPWHEANRSLRALLENIVYTKEVWAAALTGQTIDLNPTPAERRAPAVMLERLARSDEQLDRVFQGIDQRSAWDDTFVDALCEPPETFTYGGVFAHIMTFNGYRRVVALAALRQLGVDAQGYGDPIEYERSVMVPA